MPSVNYPVWFYIIGLWSLIWKGLALWRTAKNGQTIWFVVLLVINTFGILELVYLFKFAKKPLTLEEIKSWRSLLNRGNK